MCKCTPEIRTPFCGKPGCEWPKKTSSFQQATRLNGLHEAAAEAPVENRCQQHDEADCQQCFGPGPGFVALLKEFEQATMQRLVAVSKIDDTETSKVMFVQADKKHQETALAVIHSYKLLMDTLAGATAMHAMQQCLPIPMVLHCPRCHVQHVDRAEGDWTNPPHKSHLCAKCGLIWRPADVATVGVEKVTTRGDDDTYVPDGMVH